VQATFNTQYHYPYVVLNDEVFDPHFIDTTRKAVPESDISFGKASRTSVTCLSSLLTSCAHVPLLLACNAFAATQLPWAHARAGT
jgi:Glycolipid 2-alpha-mannosyltransferase